MACRNMILRVICIGVVGFNGCKASNESEENTIDQNNERATLHGETLVEPTLGNVLRIEEEAKRAADTPLGTPRPLTEIITGLTKNAKELKSSLLVLRRTLMRENRRDLEKEIWKEVVLQKRYDVVDYVLEVDRCAKGEVFLSDGFIEALRRNVNDEELMSIVKRHAEKKCYRYRLLEFRDNIQEFLDGELDVACCKSKGHRMSGRILKYYETYEGTNAYRRLKGYCDADRSCCNVRGRDKKLRAQTIEVSEENMPKKWTPVCEYIANKLKASAENMK